MADRVIKFRGEFDASQILTSLKNIRSQMAQAGAKDSLFTGVDKDIANAEKAMKELLTQAQKGFKNSNEIDQFAKKFEKLDLAFSKIGTELGELNIAENFAQTSPELEKINKELKQIENKNKELKKTALELVDPANKAVFSTIEFRKEISKAIEKEKDLKKAVEEVNKKQSEIGYGTINKAFNKLTSEQKAAATNSIMSSNLQFGLKEGQSVSTDFMNKYREAMSKIIIEGKNAKEVLDQLGKEINEEDKKYAESAQFVEDYAKNLQQLAQSAALAGGMEAGERGNVTQGAKKATAIGGYTTAGTFEFSSQTTALKDLNNEQQRAVSLVQQRETEENRLAAEAESVTRQINTGLQTQRTNQERATTAQRENINATRQQIDTQETLNNTFSRMTSAAQQLFSLGGAFTTLRRIIQETFQDVQNLDKAFASIAMVTSYSVQEMWNSYNDYATIAADLGQKTSSVIEASALFYQQGLKTNEALELTKDTMKLATLAGINYQEATQEMTAAIRGYNMSMEEGSHVTDVYSTLAAKAAADVKGIASAMARTASIAANAGASYENTSAFLTQMIETTQESAENIGTSLKTIIARFTEMKQNIAGTDASEFEDLDVNKVETALKSVGIALRDETGQIRDFDDIIIELSNTWDSLDRNTQRYIATIAAGSRQQSRFIALVSNNDRLQELMETAAESTGKADEQFQKYADTMEYRLNQLKTKWESFRTNLLESESFKKILDVVISGLDKINNMDFKQLITTIGIIGIFGKQTILSIIDQISGSVSAIHNGIGSAFLGLPSLFRAATNQIETQGQLSAETLAGQYNIALGENKAAILEIFNSFVNVTQELQNEKIKLEEIEQAIKNLEDNNEITTEEYRQQKELLQQQEQVVKRLSNKSANLRSNLNTIGLSPNQISDLEETARSSNNGINPSETLRQNWEATAPQLKNTISATLSNAVSSAIMTGVTTGLATGDAKKAMENAGIALIPSLLSGGMSILTKILPQLLAGLGPVIAPVAVPIIVGIIVTAISAALLYALNEHLEKNFTTQGKIEQLEKKNEELNKRIETVQKSIDSTNSDIKTSKEATNSLQKLNQEYQSLQNKTVKTEEEQEKYNEIVKELIEAYPELNKYYNQATGELTLQQETIDNIINQQKDEQKELQKKLLLQKNISTELNKQKRINDNQINTLNLHRSSINDTQEGGLSSYLKEIGNTIVQIQTLGWVNPTDTPQTKSEQIIELQTEGLSAKEIVEELEKDGLDLATAQEATGITLKNEEDYGELLKFMQENEKEYEENLNKMEQNQIKQQRILAEQERKEQIGNLSEYLQATNEDIGVYLAQYLAQKGIDNVNKGQISSDDLQERLKNEGQLLTTQERAALNEAWGKNLIDGSEQYSSLSQYLNSIDDEADYQTLANLINEFNALNQQVSVAEDEFNNMSEATKQAYSNYGKNRDSYSLQNIISGIEGQGFLKDIDKEILEEQKKEVEQLTKDISFLIGDSSEETLKVLEQTAEKELLAYKNVLLKLQDAVTTEIQKTEITRKAGEIRDKYNLSGSQLETLNSFFNWDNMNNLNEDDYFKKFKETFKLSFNMDDKELEELFNDYKQMAEDTGLYISTLTTENIDKLNEATIGINDTIIKSSDLFTQLSKLNPEGKKTVETYDKEIATQIQEFVKEYNKYAEEAQEEIIEITDIVKVNENGKFIIDYKKLIEIKNADYFQQQIDLNKEKVEEFRKKNNELVKELSTGRNSKNIEEQMKYNSNQIALLQELINTMQEYIDKEKERVEFEENLTGDSITDYYNKVTAALSNLISTYDSWINSSDENEILDLDELNSFKETITTLNDDIKEVFPSLEVDALDYSEFLEKTADGYKLNTRELRTYIETLITKMKAELEDGTITGEKLEKQQEKIEELEALLGELSAADQKKAQTDAENVQKAAEDAQKAAEKAEKEAEEARKKIEEAEKAQLDFIKSMGGMVSTYKSAASEMIKNGKVTSNTYASLADNIASINERYNTGMSIDNYINAAGQFNWSQYEKDLESFIIQLRKEGKEAGYLTQVLNDLHDVHEELNKEIKEMEKAYEDALESVKDAEKGVVEANKNLSEAYEDLADKEQAVIEAQQELNELMYGTGDKRKSTLDGMYNYTQLLDVIDTQLDDIKDKIENLSPNDDIAGTIQEYAQGMHNKKVNLEGQKRIYERNLDSVYSELSEYSSYFREQNGRLLIDVASLNAASMNDTIKNQIESLVESYNDSAKKISDIDKQIRAVEKEFLDFRKQYRDKQIQLQEKVISTLKQSAQEELDTTKNKYSALEEADNEYTAALEEAIQKQRELRTQANDWEDLAQKEKKLSLLQRDTSGANQKEVMKQQEDIEKSRENLLDKGIDNIIKNLKNLYSEQKKTRDAEIKYQQAVLDNANYIEEANAVISSWQTADDLISWFMEHNAEVQDMTNEQMEQYSEELEELYVAREIYMNTSIEDFMQMMDTEESEIDNTVTDTAEWLTSEAHRAMEEVKREVEKSIQEGKQKLLEAEQAVDEAKTKIVDALKEVAKAVEALETANKNAAEAAKALASAQKTANSAAQSAGNNTSSGESAFSGSKNSQKSEIEQHIDNVRDQVFNQGWTNTNYLFSDDEMKEISRTLGIYIGQNGGITYFGKTVDELKRNMGFPSNSTITGYFGNGNRYAKGGLVDYTGPAWVDGTPAQPEAFLSAKDTQMISNFTDVLRSLYTSIGSSNSQQVNPSIGDTHIEVHINIENVASDYDVDSAVERVKQDIIDAANQTGRNVILYQ